MIDGHPCCGAFCSAGLLDALLLLLLHLDVMQARWRPLLSLGTHQCVLSLQSLHVDSSSMHLHQLRCSLSLQCPCSGWLPAAFVLASLLFHCNLLMFAGLASPCFFVCWQNQLRASAVHLSAVVMALRKGFALNWHHHIVGL
ncbi:hypothetical protein COO60DRAFT_1227828 [Scenedesmus sp. NREL 46B-D3]|nr:hypothetical protein COO60DRAFT_1227828 [Scenedesmus sp. NREL 46B-D3]